MTRLARLAAWAAGLRDTDVPDRVREYATSQVLSQLAAIRAGARHPTAAKVTAAFGGPTQADRKSAACVLAALGSWLNLDDTAYAGHLSNSTVAVPLAYARDGADLVTAVVAANECAARITAAATLGPLRGQSAMHTHLAGAVAGRLKTEDAPPRPGPTRCRSPSRCRTGRCCAVSSPARPARWPP
ncbi:hypothetical protein ACFQV2_34575 [Actinokineospora soli]|uniref:MmgE/PrpD family protein n=1 Tax=Actinokineospora soli TaxID=1048753 RepID=A0ABW2TYH8_9PSEU